MFRMNEVLIVEGKYDAARLAGIVDTLILTTGGFSIFRDEEKRDLIVELGKKRGLVILTDSDAAGFKIRDYINKFACNVPIKNVYIPNVVGKESRKPTASKEGFLGVEGIDDNVLLDIFKKAGISTQLKPKVGTQITYTDLYLLGISGTDNAAQKRRELLNKIGLPMRLSKKALVEVLNSLYTLEEFSKIIAE